MCDWTIGSIPSFSNDQQIGFLNYLQDQTTLDDLLPEDPPINDDPDNEPSWHLMHRIARSKYIIKSASDRITNWIDKIDRATAMGKLLRYKKSQVTQFIRRKTITPNSRPMTANMRNNFEEVIMYQRISLVRSDRIKSQIEEYCRVVMQQIYEFEHVKSESIFQSDINACNDHIRMLDDIFQEWVDSSNNMGAEHKKTKAFIKRCVRIFKKFAP